MVKRSLARSLAGLHPWGRRSRRRTPHRTLGAGPAHQPLAHPLGLACQLPRATRRLRGPLQRTTLGTSLAAELHAHMCHASARGACRRSGALVLVMGAARELALPAWQQRQGAAQGTPCPTLGVGGCHRGCCGALTCSSGAWGQPERRGNLSPAQAGTEMQGGWAARRSCVTYWGVTEGVGRRQEPAGEAGGDGGIVGGRGCDVAVRKSRKCAGACPPCHTTATLLQCTTWPCCGWRSPLPSAALPGAYMGRNCGTGCY